MASSRTFEISEMKVVPKSTYPWKQSRMTSWQLLLNPEEDIAKTEHDKATYIGIAKTEHDRAVYVRIAKTEHGGPRRPSRHSVYTVGLSAHR